MPYNPNEPDPQRYRVNLICTCQTHLAFGYGETEADARTNAVAFFRKEHRGKTWAEEIVERVSDDGTHYVEVQR
jgi:hypothetical protein